MFEKFWSITLVKETKCCGPKLFRTKIENDRPNRGDKNRAALEYCSQNPQDWVRALKSEATTCLQKVGFGGLLVIPILTVSNIGKLGNEAWPAYIVALVLFIGFFLISAFRPVTAQAISRQYFDAIWISLILGCCFLIYRGEVVGKTSVNAPVQGVLILASVLNFYGKKRFLFLRNLTFGGIALGALFLASPSYARMAVPQIILALGSSAFAVYLLGMLRIKFYTNATNIKKYVHFAREFEPETFPHIFQWVNEGRIKDECMPIDKVRVPVAKIDVTNSTSILERGDPREVESYERALEKCWICCETDVVYARYRHDREQIFSDAYVANYAGDAIFLTFGFPFEIPDETVPRATALSVIIQCLFVFDKVMAEFPDLYCAVGYVEDEVRGHWKPAQYNRQYSVFGPALTLSSRFEETKHVLMDRLGLNSCHFILLGASIYEQLPKTLQDKFSFSELRIRNMPDETGVYYWALSRQDVAQLANHIVPGTDFEGWFFDQAA